MSNDKIKPTAFVVCKEQIAKAKDGQVWSYWKGSLNVNGVWCSTIVKKTKNGDMLIELYAKKS